MRCGCMMANEVDTAKKPNTEQPKRSQKTVCDHGHLKLIVSQCMIANSKGFVEVIMKPSHHHTYTMCFYKNICRNALTMFTQNWQHITLKDRTGYDIVFHSVFANLRTESSAHQVAWAVTCISLQSCILSNIVSTVTTNVNLAPSCKQSEAEKSQCTLSHISHHSIEGNRKLRQGPHMNAAIKNNSYMLLQKPKNPNTCPCFKTSCLAHPFQEFALGSSALCVSGAVVTHSFLALRILKTSTKSASLSWPAWTCNLFFRFIAFFMSRAHFFFCSLSARCVSFRSWIFCNKSLLLLEGDDEDPAELPASEGVGTGEVGAEGNPATISVGISSAPEMRSAALSVMAQSHKSS